MVGALSLADICERIEVAVRAGDPRVIAEAESVSGAGSRPGARGYGGGVPPNSGHNA